MCQTTDLSIVQVNRTGRKSGSECIIRICASRYESLGETVREPLCSTIGLDEAKEDTQG